MSENAVKKENWGSRIGYILSTLGMSIGVGAMWRFPMLTAKYGGGTFVLAFIIISIVAVIPVGWAESALGRKYKRSTAGNLEAVAGKKGKAFGTFMAAIPMCLAFYYPVVMAICAVYMGSTIGGAPFLNDVEGYYNQINANRPLIYAIVLAVIILTALISLGGIKKGVEKCCKILLPALFVVLLVVDIRVFTLDGIAEGLNYYLSFDIKSLGSIELWSAAAGMALFAVGLGPGYLMTYGSFMSDKADLATDFVTVNVTQLLLCVMSGFACIPAVVLFGLDPLAGKGLIFQSLPKIFSTLSGGMIFFFLFMLAIFFAGLSTCISLVEVPVTCLVDTLGWSRKKAVWVVTLICALGAIPCVWSDTFFAFFDNLVGNVFYCLSAAVVAFYLAWIVGATKIRTEWYNPTSVIKYGSWVDVLYKFIAVPAFVYFAVTAIMTLF